MIDVQDFLHFQRVPDAVYASALAEDLRWSGSNASEIFVDHLCGDPDLSTMPARMDLIPSVEDLEHVVAHEIDYAQELIPDQLVSDPDLSTMPDWLDIAPPIAMEKQHTELPIPVIDAGGADNNRTEYVKNSVTGNGSGSVTAPVPMAYVPGTNWPNPDMALLRPERPPAPVLSEEDFLVIFGPWADWIKSAAKAKGAPEDYVALALLCVASACIGNTRWASPWESWKEPPILWGMLVGNPSSGKSPALDAVLDPLKEIERSMAEDFKTSHFMWAAEDEIASLVLAQWKADAKKAIAAREEPPEKPKAADAGPPPLRERITISDATIEKVAELLAAHWRGLMLKRDELSGWIEGMSRYNDGGDRPFWLEAFGGRPFTVDRKSNPDPIIIDKLFVAVLGGIQPDKLDGLIKSADDGLLARHLIVFPDPVPLARPDERIDDVCLKAALEKLRGLQPAQDERGNPHPLVLHFTEEAANKLQEFRLACRKWEADASPLFRGHTGKMPGMAVRIACVLAHLDWAAGKNVEMPATINGNQVERACRLIGDHYRLHAFRAYGANEVPNEVRNAQRLARIIRQEQLRRFTVREIQRRELAGMQKAAIIECALGVLEAADWVRKDSEPTGGRRRTFYTVNPKLQG